MKIIQKYCYLFLLLGLSQASLGVEIIKLDASHELGKVAALPDYAKETIIVVSINGLNFGEFHSGGRVSAYQISPASVYGNDKIKKIAETMHKAGIRIEEAYIQVISNLQVQEFAHASEQFANALTLAYHSVTPSSSHAVASSSSSSSQAIVPSSATSALNQAATSIPPMIRRFSKAEQEYRSIVQILQSQDNLAYLETFLEFCLHAEAAFMDKYLLSIQHPSNRISPEFIILYGNRDPCFQCQVTISKLADLIHQKGSGTLKEICYYSKNVFEGPCKLPVSVCDATALKDVSYAPGNTYATRFQKDDGELLLFRFEPKKPIEVRLFNRIKK